MFARSWDFRSFSGFGFWNFLSGFRVGLSVLDYLVKDSYYVGMVLSTTGDHCEVDDHGEIGHGVGIVCAWRQF